MRDLLSSFRMLFLIGRLAVFGLAVVAATIASAIHYVSDRLRYQTVPARIDRLAVNCHTPDGEADCTMLSAMAAKPGMETDPHTIVWLRYFSPADGREHAASVDRDGDLSRTLHPGGAIQISANTLDAEKIR